MAFSELETKRVEKALSSFLERKRPPAHIRSKLDLDYRIDGQSVEVFEIRPVWNDPSRKMENSVAKSTFVKSKGVWKVFWMRQDLKWHSYEPVKTVGSIEKFLKVVEEDRYACFWG